MSNETKIETKECQQAKVKEYGINCIKFLYSSDVVVQVLDARDP